MATGWETLGSVLGGGVDTAGAYETGRLRTAQTETALLRARELQLSNVAAEKKAKALDEADAAMAAAGVDPKQAKLLQNIALGEYGTDFSAGMTGLAKQQEIGFRDTLADPSAPLGEQFAAGQGVQGKMLNPLDMMGAGDYVDLRALPAPGVKPTLESTPLGESMIEENRSTVGANRALEGLRDVQAGDPDYRTAGSGGGGSIAPSGVKVPAGMMPNPNYNPALPVGEGNYPLMSAVPPTTGSVEHRVNQRMVRSAAQLVPDLANLLSMPAESSLGVIGTGNIPGASMMQSTVDALRNTLTDDVARAYESQSGQIATAMAFIESNGFAPNEAILNESKRAYTIRPGHTGFDVLRIFANLRQNIEQFNAVQQADSRVPADVRALLQQLTEQTRNSVPFTVEQVNALQFSKHPGLTMEQMMRSHGFNPQPNRGVPGAAPSPGVAPPPRAPENDWTPLPDGRRIRIKTGG